MSGKKTVGAGGCQRARVAQSSCSRKWSRVKVRLCSKCDELFGSTVGDSVH